MEINTITRKWGSSLAIIIPKKFINENNIKENEKIILELKKKPLAGELFGRFPNWKKSGEQIKKDMRKGW